MYLNKDLIFIHLIGVWYIAFQYKDLHFKFSENFFCYLLFPPSGTSVYLTLNLLDLYSNFYIICSIFSSFLLLYVLGNTFAFIF